MRGAPGASAVQPPAPLSLRWSAFQPRPLPPPAAAQRLPWRGVLVSVSRWKGIACDPEVVLPSRPWNRTATSAWRTVWPAFVATAARVFSFESRDFGK